MTIGRFLEKVKSELRNQFRDLQSVSAEDLMYVKEDLIIPARKIYYEVRDDGPGTDLFETGIIEEQ